MHLVATPASEERQPETKFEQPRPRASGVARRNASAIARPEHARAPCAVRPSGRQRHQLRHQRDDRPALLQGRSGRLLPRPDDRLSGPRTARAPGFRPLRRLLPEPQRGVAGVVHGQFAAASDRPVAGGLGGPVGSAGAAVVRRWPDGAGIGGLDSAGGAAIFAAARVHSSAGDRPSRIDGGHGDRCLRGRLAVERTGTVAWYGELSVTLVYVVMGPAACAAACWRLRLLARRQSARLDSGRGAVAIGVTTGVLPVGPWPAT